MDNIRVIYISPNYGDYCNLYDEMLDMSDAEKVAKVYELDCDEVELLTLDQFQAAFNGDIMSDLGFMFFVKV